MTDPHKPFRELIDGAKSALNELQRINITVDGMPFVSHGLCYNLTNKIAAAEAALPALADDGSLTGISYTELKAENARLSAALAEAESWKSQQLAVESDWDAQVVGRTLGMKLGDNIRRNLLPKIQQLQAQLASQQEALVAARDALNDIATHGPMMLTSFPPKDYAQERAKEALTRVNACLPEGTK